MITRGRVRNTILAVVTGAAAVILTVLSKPGLPPPPPPGSANAWIATTQGANPQVCHPACAFDSTKAFGSMQAAQTAMSAGDLAIMRCGAYPAQTLSSSQKASAVTYQAETYDQPTDWRGAYTMTTCTTIGGNGLTITIDKIHIVGIEATPTPHDFGDGHVYQFQDSQNCINTSNCALDATHPGMLAICPSTDCHTFTDILIDYWKGGLATLNASGTTFDHGNMGDFDVCYLGSLNSYAHVAVQPNGSPQVAGLGGDVMHAPWPQLSSNPGLSNLIVRNSAFHDDLHGLGNSEPLQCSVPGATGDGAHADLIQGNGCVDNCRIESSAFWNGGDKPIQWTQFCSSPCTSLAMNNTYVQNNFLDGEFNTFSSYGQTVADCSTMYWQNNLGQGPNITAVAGTPCATTAANAPIVRNNIEPFKHQTCGVPPIRFSHNVYDPTSTVTCGSGGNASIKCTPQWVTNPNYTSGVNTVRSGPPANLTLASADTCAQNFSDAAFASPDWLGVIRPQGPGADAGPSEIGVDSTSPLVSVTSPSSGATVSGTTSVTATASDNVGVVGVQFKVDSSNLGAEDTTAPYSVSWDTTATTNGTHVLSAIARDAAGNTATSSNVSVTVNNGATVHSGLSSAVCEPTPPCTQPTGGQGQPAGWTAPISVGSVSNDQDPATCASSVAPSPCPSFSNRSIQVWRPVGLTARPGNLAPAIISTGSCSSAIDPGHVTALAASHKYVVIWPDCGPNDGGSSPLWCTATPTPANCIQSPDPKYYYCSTGRCFGPNWYKKQIDNPPLGTARKPGANDIPMIVATYNYITQCPSSGATAGQCIDPENVWYVGDSSTAALGPDVMCDASSHNVLRGVYMISNSIQTGPTQTGIPNCPSPSTQATFMMISTGHYDNGNPSHFWSSSPTSIVGDTLSPGGSYAFSNCGNPWYWGGGSGCTGTAPSVNSVEGCTGGITTITTFIPPGGSPSGTAHRRSDANGPCLTGVQAGSVAVEGWNLEFGGHGEVCQDSDITSATGCNNSLVVGGTTCAANIIAPNPNKCPKTNNWYGIQMYVNFIEQASWTGP